MVFALLVDLWPLGSPVFVQVIFVGIVISKVLFPVFIGVFFPADIG
jgi:hypothetical protein